MQYMPFALSSPSGPQQIVGVSTAGRKPLPALLLALCLAFLLGPGLSPASAQGGSVLPLKGKTAAVYFSKKQFSYNQYFYHDLSQFIKVQAGDKILVQDAKLQSIIAFGSLFAEQLGEASGADSVFFLNAFPDLARKFIRAYDSDERTLQSLGDGMPGVDFILVINPMSLVMRKVPAVLTRSNRLETVYDYVKTGKVEMDMLDPATGRLAGRYAVCVNETTTRIPERLFSFYADESRMGDFLGKLFSTLVHYMNLGEPGNCDAPEPVDDLEEWEE